MNILPALLPRALDIQGLQDDPLIFLQRAQRDCGDLVVLRDKAAIFSRTDRCAGSLAVFGKKKIRQVLTDICVFGLPESAASRLALPQRLVNLNFSLHGRLGEQHGRHLRLLKRVLNEPSVAGQQPLVVASLETFAKGLKVEREFGLLGAMRELTLQISSRLLLGDRSADSYNIGFLLRAYFELRREAAGPFRDVDKQARKALIELGLAADEALRHRIRQARKGNATSRETILGMLAGALASPDAEYTEDEIAGHLNVLFISSTEPVAIALTWIILILSQRADLRAELRQHIGTPSTLLDRVVRESLRLLPPNALMLRLTKEPTLLDGVRIPRNCEILLCPLVAHRDPEVFANPDLFMPSRWTDLAPSPFEYFPFGGGGHYCTGAHLAMSIIKTALEYLLVRYDLVLSQDQDIDWRIDVQLVPDGELLVTAWHAGDRAKRGGKIGGPVHSLFKSHA